MSGEPGATEQPKGVDALTLHPDVYASRSLGRAGNLTAVLDAHQKSNSEFWLGLKDRSVLVRPNIVDPEFPQGCSHPDALKSLLEKLVSSGVSKIDIGDLSAADYYDTHRQTRPQNIYKELVDGLSQRYPQVEIALKDLRELNQVPLTGELSVIDTSSYAALVNLALPKEHGQYYFSGGAKHLMGLVDPSKRREYFHPDLPEGAQLRVHNDPVKSQQIRSTITETDPARANVEYNAKLSAAAESDVDPLIMRSMATFIQATVNHFARKGQPVLTVVDGHETLTGHEHHGVLKKTDFAAVGLNPVAVDISVARHLGLLNQTGYLTNLAHLVRPVIRAGDLPEAPSRRLRRVATNIQMFDDQSYGFGLGVVPDETPSRWDPF